MRENKKRSQSLSGAAPNKEAVAAEEGNVQRFPSRMLVGRRGNTEVKNGLCYIVTRSQLDPRHTKPQFIDETYMDRNRLESLNFQILNPDIETRSFVKCLCTRVISLRDDWYVHLHDGTVLCNACARCFRCWTICFTAARKLNSIDGLVLCNNCMLSYGCYRVPKPRLRLQPLRRVLEDIAASKNQEPRATVDAMGSNANDLAESSDHWARSNASNNSAGPTDQGAAKDSQAFETLAEPRFRDEGRKPIRKIFYPNLRPAGHGRPDYRYEAPPYLGVDRNDGSQVCPKCGTQALPSQALVVPGHASVYHERSFSCVNCKRPMHMGYQIPGTQFECCDCPKQPKVWCTSRTCRLARVAHHAEMKCQLAPVHPGGRPKRDVPGIVPRFDPVLQRKLEKKILKLHNRLEVSWQERRKQLLEEAANDKNKRS